MAEESARAAQSYADYLALGAGRSLVKLLGEYAERVRSGSGVPPTTRLNTLKKWSAAHDWQGRIADLARAAQEEAEEAQRAYVRAIMETGLALSHERVRVLKELAGTLLDDLTTGERRWLRDKKSIVTGREPVMSDDGATLLGSVPTYEVVELERGNAPWIEQVRGLLDDLAKEVGARVTKAELTGKGGGAIVVERVLFGGDDDQD